MLPLKCLAGLTLAVGGAALAATTAAPFAVAAMAGGLMSGVAGNILHEVYGAGEARLAKAIFRRHPGIDQNHHVLLAVRQAHLRALSAVLTRFDEARRAAPSSERGHDSERFLAEARRFLSEAGLERTARLGPVQEFERAVFASLPEAMDAALAARGGAEHSAATVRDAAIDAVLVELGEETATAVEAMPSLFLTAFRDEQDGWFDLFVRDAAAGLKDNADFRNIWIAEKLAHIDTVVSQFAGMETRLEANAERRHQIEIDRVAALEAKIDRLTGVVLDAAAKSDGGVSLEGESKGAVRSAVSGLVTRNRPDDAIAQARLEAKDVIGAVDSMMAASQTDVAVAAERLRDAGALAYGVDTRRAISAYREAVRLDPRHFWSRISLVRLLENAGSGPAAEAEARAAIDIAETRRHQAIAHHELGDQLANQGRRQDAMQSYGVCRAITAELAASDADNALIQNDLSIIHMKMGAVLLTEGRLRDARAAFDVSLGIAEGLALSHPDDTGWQRDLSVSHNKIGEALAAEGKLPEARPFFEKSLEIRLKLAASDPDNTDWQRDLSVSHNKIGDVLVVEGKLSDARAAFEAGLSIAQDLASSDPDNAGWQRDLSISHDRVGSVLEAEGKSAEARAFFEAGLAISRKLASTDPGNVAWQRDLIISHVKLSDPASALAIAKQLHVDGRLAPSDAWMIPDLEAQIAALE